MNREELLDSLQGWCREHGVKIRLTFDNYIAIEENIKQRPLPAVDDYIKDQVFAKNLIFIDEECVISEGKDI